MEVCEDVVKVERQPADTEDQDDWRQQRHGASSRSLVTDSLTFGRQQTAAAARQPGQVSTTPPQPTRDTPVRQRRHEHRQHVLADERCHGYVTLDDVRRRGIDDAAACGWVE